MFTTYRELIDIKKCLINIKMYDLLGITDLKKINNWNQIKGQCLRINPTLEEQKEINNIRHLYFPFTTPILNDL